MANVLVLFHVQDAAGNPIAFPLVDAGVWKREGNACGDLWAWLGTGQYKAIISAKGFLPTERNWDFQLQPDAPVLIGLETAFPPPPSRDEILKGQVTAQGLVVQTTKYGAMPWWPGAWAWLDAPTRKEVGAQLLAVGDTICVMELPAGPALYDEPPPNFYTADKFGPLDLTNPITQFIDIVRETLQMGFKGVWVILGGDDGERGFPIAVAQAQALGAALGDLNKYVVQIPGWDGVFYGYTPQHVHDFAVAAKAAGALYVGVEHNTAHIPVGNGPADYQQGGLMTPFDLVLGEFDDDRFDDSVWQVLGRMLGPAYVRPPDQPAGDDLHPPFYLEGSPVVYRVWEFYMYGFVRGASAAHVAQCKQYFQKCGAHGVC